MSEKTAVLSTSTVTVESLLATHEATSGAKRRTLRDSWTRIGGEAMLADDIETAKTYARASIAAAAVTSTRTSTAADIDWRQVTANRIDALRRAADAIESGEVRPSGTPEDIDLTDLPEPDASTHTAALSLAGVRLAGQRNVPTFIAERVAELGDGWHTASELAVGQVDAPSTGAIGAVYAKMALKGFVVTGVVAGRNAKSTQAFSAE